MPWGIIINCSSVAVGGLLGKIAGVFIPDRISCYLSNFFGISSIAIGITLIQKSDSLSPVMLALILGAIVGEALNLEALMGRFPGFLYKHILHCGTEIHKDSFVEHFTGVLILICSGSLGLMGAMTEGMTGSSSILITKSVLDLFGAAIFASTLGIGVALISIPQFLIYLLLYWAAGLVMPLVTPAMAADFMGCGGVIALVTGIRISEIKLIRVSSLLPALILIMPISAIWHMMIP